ncbi:MAG: tyrosine--tRNA ligase [Tissierellia bacterium]|nr:tyrosine--tRNA ligase [Tissierellia bacterium]
MRNVYDVLEERGFLDTANFPEDLKELLGKESIVFYIGFDATADSLTLGHYSTIMAMKHMQNHGHIPLVLMGGGTTMIGDPSGRNDMRSLMSEEFIDGNVEKFLEQMARFLDLSEGKAIVDNNKKWLLNLNFVNFMREIGIHFNVNRMLTFDIYKNRINEGLTFFEMGYMLLQSYDFWELYTRYNCKLQMGGSDQWANMLGGTELVWQKEEEKVYCQTLKLLANSEGVKMGKTMSGAIWLDINKTSGYELFQYLRNSDDRDVITYLKRLTMIPMEEINELAKLEGKELNKAKEILAYEVVKDVHGKEEADKALEAAKALFQGAGSTENMPSTEIEVSRLEEGLGLLSLLTEVGLTKSNGEARRLVQQAGIFIDDKTVEDINKIITKKDFKDGKLIIRKGKKVFHQLIIK